MFKKIILLTLACMLVLTSLTGCFFKSSYGEKLMELDGEEMSVNSVMLLMSRLKGNMSSAYAYGTQALTNSFWDTVMDAGAKVTYDTYYTNMVVDNAKTYLAALAYFDELGLKLPEETMDEIDERMKTLVDTDGDGSKAALNAILADFGANYNILRQSYIVEAKVTYLKDYLFGTDGSKISAENYNEYYKTNYARFRQIFFFTTKPVYETDINGDVIYYSSLTDKKIAYNSALEGAYRKDNTETKYNKDEKGDYIWYYTDAEGKEHIAYDKNGSDDVPTYPNPLLDDEGNVRTEKLTKDELIKLSDKVQLILDGEAREGEYTLFDSLVTKYGEDEGMEQYPSGYYMTATSDYDSPEVVKALFEMKDGEIRRIESDYGIHIVMKYPLEENGYALEENADFFRNEDGTYNFLGIIQSNLLDAYVADYKAKIVIDEDKLKELSMKNVGANYNY